jgi:hypothetical protein
MAITVPVADTELTVAGWGKPVTDEVNRMTPLVSASPPGRIWINALNAVNATSGWTQIPGSAVKPTETGARKWIVQTFIPLDPSEPGKMTYIQLNINGGVITQYGIYIPAGNSASMAMWAFGPTAITSCEIIASGWKVGASGKMVFIDGGP